MPRHAIKADCAYGTDGDDCLQERTGVEMADTPDLARPLLNRTALLTCSAKKMPALVRGIREMGGNAIPFPAIEIRDIEDKAPLDSALRRLHHYSWILFTSAYAVLYFTKRLRELGIQWPSSPATRICAIGPATAAEAQESGFHVELVPEDYVAEGVVQALAKYCGGLHVLAGRRILLPRALEAREVLPEALLDAGALVDVIPCYRTVRAAPDRALLQQLKEAAPDLILFTSSSGVRSFVELFGEQEGRNLLAKSVVAAIGPITGSTVASYGKRAEIIPDENTIDSLLEAIRRYYYIRHATIRDYA
jgi:uroporphyrinogen III methyltransferase/synthase